ncbi:MAG: biotin carboxyl carrier protein [Gammaproteobacteria bacterium]|nr:biotin carboxyl carrier protein [Gammaproteobacteria bacterium]
MSLTAKDVAQITRLLEESSFDELYLEIDGLKLSLRRGSAPNAQSLVDPAAALAPSPAPPATPPDPNTLMVSAPLLGTFYRAPKPGAAPFVEIGSQVAEDTIVGIIEVMKLMNTVRAGVRGKVTQILARDGALVEYGETLLRVSKTS